MNPHQPFTGWTPLNPHPAPLPPPRPVASHGSTAVSSSPPPRPHPIPDVMKSTATLGSPHVSSSTHTTRIALKSPFSESHHIEMETEDEPTAIAATAASSSNVACPSLPLPYPHRRTSNNILQELNLRASRSVGVSQIAFKRRMQSHQYSRFELAHTVPAHVPSPSLPEEELADMKKKSKIMEIVATGNFVFTLTQAGVCTAFDNRTMKQLCLMNILAEEVIRSLFYNRANRNLITVSVYRHDNWASLRCRSTPLEAIAAGKPELGVSIFSSESLAWPGFVEFDDVNKKIVTYSSQSKRYKIWNLSDYNFNYEISNSNVEEIKVSPGIMLLIMKRTQTTCPMRIVAIDTGETLQEFAHPLQPNVKVQFVEQFNEKLLLKQKKHPLHMIDIHDPQKSVVLRSSQFPSPSAFIFLYENQLFLTFVKREIAIWNFAGQRAARFEDHYNWWPDCNTNNIYINQDQDLLISYCLTPAQVNAMHNRRVDPLAWKNLRRRTGSINISSVFTGRCISKIEKRRQLKYPFHLLTTAQQRSALQDYRRVHGNRLRRVMEAAAQVSTLSRGDSDTSTRHAVLYPTDAMEDIPPVCSSPPVQNAQQRALELQQEARNLQRLLEINQQQQQQLNSPPIVAAAAASSSSPIPAVTFAPMMDNNAPMNTADNDDGGSDTESVASDHSEAEEREIDALELLEQQGQMSASRVLFPNQVESPIDDSSTIPKDQLGQVEVRLDTIEAYRAYNRAVRDRNAALKDVTAVYFNEDRCELYTGNKAGKLSVWRH